MEDIQVKRTTIMLPQSLKVQAAEYARNLGLSLGELIRKSLERVLGDTPGNDSKGDPLFDSKAVFRGSTPRDLSLKHDDYLYGEKIRGLR